MRQPIQRIILLVLVALSIIGHASYADNKDEARAHYKAGVKAYSSGDYQTAIKEFSAAQQLAPADLNNYNLALCYDKLGDAEPAVQYYREYLNKVPNSDKRAEVEASIARLDAAVKSIQAKKAEEARKAEAAQKAEEARKADEAKKAEEAQKAEAAKAEQAKAEEAKKVEPPRNGGEVAGGGPAVSAGVGVGGVATGEGSTGEPSTGQIVSTGDAQLDRVQQIDINAIRDQRFGAAGSGLPDNHGGPATAGATGAAQGPATPAPNGQLPPPNGQAQQAPQNPQAVGQTDKTAPKETPVYKKWWFWAVVAVSAYVVYEIATTNSQPQPGVRARETEAPTSPGKGMGGGGGVPLFHF